MAGHGYEQPVVHKPCCILHTAAANRCGKVWTLGPSLDRCVGDFLVVANDAKMEDVDDEQKGIQSHRNMNLLAMRM